jgi:hypothetical protein
VALAELGDVPRRLGEDRRRVLGRSRKRPFSTTRVSVGSIARKSLLITWRAISAMAPASSTPVGPPPTTTIVSSACRASAVANGSTSANVRL